MDDLISRHAVLALPRNKVRDLRTYEVIEETINVKDIENIPSAQPEEIALHESCTDCPLYDKDRHSCPRFNKVIPETLREVQSDKRLEKITDLVEGTIDHFDKDDAMDLLYQIKEVLNER